MNAAMSIHSKIIAWFVVFAVLTVMVFGLGDYIQTTRSLGYAMETRAAALALQVTGDVERRHQELETELLGIGYAFATGAAAPPAGLRHYSRLTVTRGAELVYDAEQPAPAAVCAADDVILTVSFEAGNGEAYVVRGRAPAERVFGAVSGAGARLGEHGMAVVLRSTDGAGVFAADCRPTARSWLNPDLVQRALVQAEARTGDAVVLEGTGGRNGEAILAAARTGEGWTILVAFDGAQFAAPLVTLRRQYFGATGGILLLALLVVVAGIRHDMRRLAAISNAADAIGHGRFDVWLPPPTGDEIGRVSLALGRMADRLASNLRQIEVSRSMAAVGELAAYLSHEIRNPLSSIRLNLQMLRRDLRSGTVPDDGDELVGLCLSELQRLDDVVRTVLEIGRPNPEVRGSCAAHGIIAETLRIMQRKFTEADVTVIPALEARHDDVAMTSAALRGTVMNLVLNAVDAVAAMPKRRIVVSSRLLEPYGDAPRFELRVADSGPGVPPHVRERIFDPFFTTKASGNGIGLATALRAVQECGGMLRYEPSSEWSAGAEFVVELPLCEPVPGAASRALVAAGA
jgi:signal transduction histidine kinase